MRDAVMTGFRYGEVTDVENLARMIPHDARTFVDIGCGEGTVLGMLRSVRRDLQLCGVEIVAARAALAQRRVPSVCIHTCDGILFITHSIRTANTTLFINDVAFISGVRCALLAAAAGNPAVTCVVTMSGQGPSTFELEGVAPARVSWRAGPGEHFYKFVRRTTWGGSRRSARAALLALAT